jgi:hypothetical protein
MIHFITPLYRYNNVRIIYSTIVNQVSEFKWHLIEGDNVLGEESLENILSDNRVFHYKIKTHFTWGHEQRNYFIQNIPADDNDWCYFLDDDNVVTHDLINETLNYENLGYDILLFSQKHGLTEQTRLLGKEGHMNLNYCDIASFAIKYGTIKNTLIPHIHERCADGYYCNMISNINKIKIKYLTDKFVRYNSLSINIYS